MMYNSVNVLKTIAGLAQGLNHFFKRQCFRLK